MLVFGGKKSLNPWIDKFLKSPLDFRFSTSSERFSLFCLLQTKEAFSWQNPNWGLQSLRCRSCYWFSCWRSYWTVKSSLTADTSVSDAAEVHRVSAERLTQASFQSLCEPWRLFDQPIVASVGFGCSRRVPAVAECEPALLVSWITARTQIRGGAAAETICLPQRLRISRLEGGGNTEVTWSHSLQPDLSSHRICRFI